MSAVSLNYLVGGRQQRFRDGKAERLGGLEVDDKLNFCGLLDWQIGWFLALVWGSGSQALVWGSGSQALVWGSGSQALFHGILHFLHTSFFVRLGIPFLRPDPHVLEAGAHRDCQGRPSLYAGHTLRRFQAAP